MGLEEALTGVKIAPMGKPTSADDILPLVIGMTPLERGRLLRLIAASPSLSASAAYAAMPRGAGEFSSDEQLLEWDTEGWEHFD
jgi:hypothetical protein